MKQKISFFLFFMLLGAVSNIYSSDAWIEVADFTGTEDNDPEVKAALNAKGAIVAVGDKDYDNSAGRVQIFEFTDCSWNMVGTGITGDAFGQAGFSVALNEEGTMVAVGEIGYDNGAGRVRVFQYTGGAWNLVGTEITGAVGGKAGSSVALNAEGTMVAVGEIGYDNGAGRVRVFQYTGGAWNLVGTEIIGAAAGSAGASVALNAEGAMVVVGEPDYNSGIGRVRVFQYTGGAWNLIGTEITGDTDGRAGTSVALNAKGTIVAVGEPQYDSSSGRVRVFQYRGGTWDLVGSQITGAAAGSAGASVALNEEGTMVAVGEVGYDNFAGRARVFQYTGGAWDLVRTEITGESIGSVWDRVGSDVALNSEGNVIAVGNKPLNRLSNLVTPHVRIFFGPSPDGIKIAQTFNQSPAVNQSKPNDTSKYIVFAAPKKTYVFKTDLGNVPEQDSDNAPNFSCLSGGTV